MIRTMIVLFVAVLTFAGCSHPKDVIIQTKIINGRTLVCVRHAQTWQADTYDCQWAPGTPTPNRSDNP